MIDLNDPKIQRFTIHLDTCIDPVGITKYMVGITDYCYAFVHVTGVMKIGESQYTPKPGVYPGDRIYRQARYIPGWPTAPQPDGYGEDMDVLIKKFYPNIHKDDVMIRIWDLTNVNFLQADNHKHETQQLETILIEAHKEATGIYPPGNKRIGHTTKYKAVVPDQTFDSVFIYKPEFTV
jgi:hypothetical protein